MQTGSSGTLIGYKSVQTTFVPLWDRMEGAWLRSLDFPAIPNVEAATMTAAPSHVLSPEYTAQCTCTYSHTHMYVSM